MRDATQKVGVLPGADTTTKTLYRRLAAGGDGEELDIAAEAFLCTRLDEATAAEPALPAEPEELLDWVPARAAEAGLAFQRYLAERRAGAPRRFFSTRAHALQFLRAVAPTKLVDGSWLHGLVGRWRDARVRGLISTYLDELGDGAASHNHVAIYQRLLAAHDCEDWQQELPDGYFLEGATQLALGRLAERYLPEVIGYNLGYEQPPLHLFITAHELSELDVDPWYFTLHVTVDNGASGHAVLAARAVSQALPVFGDSRTFWRRVRLGFALSDLGPGSTDAIRNLDLDRELIRILGSKAQVGRCMHSDRIRIGGRTVNQWLASAASMPAFLAALEREDWLRRGQTPEASRFWRLLVGEGASMTGVFTGYERQVIADWLQGAEASARPPRVPMHACGSRVSSASPAAQGEEERALVGEIGSATEPEAAVRVLAPLLAPAAHATPVGLMATRIYARLFRGMPLARAMAQERRA